MYSKSTTYSISIILCFSLSLLFNSCKKEAKVKEEEKTHAGIGDTKITFEIKGLSNSIDGRSKGSMAKSPNALSTNNDQQAPIESRIVSLNGMDAMLSIHELPVNYQLTASASKATHPGIKAQDFSTLATGTKYKILLFNTDGHGNPTTLHDEVEGVVGPEPLKIQAYAGKEYRWYAYTFNSKSPIPPFGGFDELPIVPSGEINAYRKDFAFATDVLNTFPDQTKPNIIRSIILTRKTASMVIEYNTKGLFAQIISAKARLADNANQNQQGNFNFKTGKYTKFTTHTAGLESANDRSVSISVPMGVDTVVIPNTKVRQTFYVPTDGVTPIQLKISLDTLMVTSQLLDEELQPKEVQRSFRNNVFEIPDFVATEGKSYFISIKLLESPMPIGTTQWARGNTYIYTNSAFPNDTSSKYQIRYDNIMYKPNTIPFSEYILGSELYLPNGLNVCEAMYPQGLWDLPNRAEYEELINYTNKEVLEDGLQSWYIRVNPDVPVLGPPAYPSDRLIIAPMGIKEPGISTSVSYFQHTDFFYLTFGFMWYKSTDNGIALLQHTHNQQDIISFDIRQPNRRVSVRCIRKK